MNKISTAFLASIFLCLTSASNAAIIDFNDNPDGIYFVSPINSDGFTATSNVERGSTPMGTNVSVDGHGPSNETVHLDSWTNYSSDSGWTLTSQDGHAFSLASFDFADGYLGGGSPVSVLTLNGTKADGNSVSQVFQINQIDFQTLTVSSDFQNLVNVKFDAFGYQNRAAYDNIVVDSANVPEPTTVALFGLGLLGFAASRRKSAK